MRRRIPRPTEELMWTLRCQGLRLEAIAFSTGFSVPAISRALRRARRRRLPASSPLRGHCRDAPGAGPAHAPRTSRHLPMAFSNRLLDARLP